MSAARCYCGRPAPEAGRPCKAHDTATRPARPSVAWSTPAPRLAPPVLHASVPPSIPGPTFAPRLRLADPAHAARLEAIVVDDGAPEPAPMTCAWHKGCDLPANDSPGVRPEHTGFCRKHQHTKHQAERRAALKAGVSAAPTGVSPPRPQCVREGCEEPAGLVRRNTNPADAAYCIPDRHKRQGFRANGYDPDAPKPVAVVVPPREPKPSPPARGHGDVPLGELLASHSAVNALGGLAALRRVGVSKLARVVAALAGGA